MTFLSRLRPHGVQSLFLVRWGRGVSLCLLAGLITAGAVHTLFGISPSRSDVGQPAGPTRFVADGLVFAVPPGVGIRYYNEPLLKNRQSVVFEVPYALLDIRLYQLYGKQYDGPFLITLRPEEERYGALSESDWRLQKLTPHVEGDWDVYEEPSGYNLYVNRVGGEPRYFSCQRLPPNVPVPSDWPGICEVDQTWPVDNLSRTTLIFGFTTNDQHKVVDLNQKVLAFMNRVLAEK